MIKVATLASLCALMISQVRASAPPINIGNNDCLFERRAGVTGKPQVTDQHYVDEPKTEPHLESNADKRTCVESMDKEFFNRLNARNVWITFLDLYNANTLQYVKEDVLKRFTAQTCEAFRAKRYVRGMTTKQIAALPNECFSDVNIGSYMSPAQIKAIVPKTTGKQHASEFLAFDRFLENMTESQLTVAAGNDLTQCSRLTLAKLVKLDKATLAKLDYRCFQAIKDVTITSDGARRIARFLNPDALKEIGPKPIPGELLKQLTPRFFEVLDKKNTDNQCTKVDLSSLKIANVGKLDKTCFLHALTAMNKENMKKLEPHFFMAAPKELFADIKDTDLIEKIAKIPGIWSALQKEHYADIMKLGPEVCAHIKFGEEEKRFTYAEDLEADCFAQMTTATQEWILEHYGMLVKEDILSKVDGSSRDSPYLKKTIRQFSFARPQILKHFGIGEASSGENVCSTYDVTDLKNQKELRRAGRYFPTNCLKSMLMVAPKDAVQYTDLSSYPKGLIGLLDMPSVIANLSDDALRNMDKTKWVEFIGPETCGALTHEKFKHVDHTIAFEHITAPCLDAFTFLDKFEANEVRSIPVKVLGAAKLDTISKLDASHFNVKQIQALGANASGLGDDIFNKFGKDQIAALNAIAVSSLPIGAFSALKPDGKWQHVTPEALASIKYDQLNAVPEDILKTTTAPQAAKISADAARAFTKCQAKLPADVAKALPQQPPPPAAKGAEVPK